MTIHLANAITSPKYMFNLTFINEFNLSIKINLIFIFKKIINKEKQLQTNTKQQKLLF